MTNLQALANAIETKNVRKDAQLAREVEFSLPVEIDHNEQIKLVERFVYSQFIKRGMVAHVALHDSNKGNPHAHVLLSLNALDATDPTGFGKKCREWNEVALLNEVRYQWSIHCNRFLSNRGIKARIDHRSLHAQGIAREPIQRMSRMDYAGQKRRAMQQTNNNHKENTMTQTHQPRSRNTAIEKLPQFRQADKVRMNQLHAEPITVEIPSDLPTFHSDFYRHWLAELFSLPSMQVEWTATDFGAGYRIKLATGSVIDYGDTLRCETSTATEIEALIKLAQAKGWQGLSLRGTEAFKQHAFVMAVAQGYSVTSIQGYAATPQDIAMANQLKLALAQAQAQLAVVQPCSASQATGQGQATTTLVVAPPKLKLGGK